MLDSIANIKKKAEKLSKWYDLSNAKDLLLVITQEMEVAEARADWKNKEGKDKKEYVMALISEILLIQNKEEIKIIDVVDEYVDNISKSSKGYWALNKKKTND